MKQDLFKITLTREQLTWVQVALLEAQLSASESNRISDAERYLQAYRIIGTEKCRVLNLQTA